MTAENDSSVVTMEQGMNEGESGEERAQTDRLDKGRGQNYMYLSQ